MPEKSQREAVFKITTHFSYFMQYFLRKSVLSSAFVRDISYRHETLNLSVRAQMMTNIKSLLNFLISINKQVNVYHSE